MEKLKAKKIITEKYPKTQEQEILLQKADDILKNLKSYTWRELETNGKFSKNDKLSFVSEDMLIVGCDIGSEIHYARAIDVRGRELSKKALAFHNNEEGLRTAKDWAVDLAVRNGKKQIVLGLEPTGHYWFALTAWMVSNEISVVQVNPYAVKQTKELEDNSQLKDDRKDPKLIANLVKDGNYGHIKAYKSWSGSCVVYGAGWSSSSASAGRSISYYWYASTVIANIQKLYNSVVAKAKTLGR